MPTSQSLIYYGQQGKLILYVLQVPASISQLFPQFMCVPSVLRTSCSATGRCDMALNTAPVQKCTFCLFMQLGSKEAQNSQFFTQKQGFVHMLCQGGVSALSSSSMEWTSQDCHLLPCFYQTSHLLPLKSMLLSTSLEWSHPVPCKSGEGSCKSIMGALLV